VLTEAYSDIPWHQKLGTDTGNEFDEAIVLPFGALQGLEGTKDSNGTIQNVAYCKTVQLPDGTVGLSPPRCMIETGINNIVSTLRIDTPYETGDMLIMEAKRCQPPDYLVPVRNSGNVVISFQCSNKNSLSNCPDTSFPSQPQPCIEVKLQIASYWTRSYDGTTLNLLQRPIGDECCGHLNDKNFGGFVITDGTTFAPQMPWYMSHYCDSLFLPNEDALDAVCYGDYLSSFNAGFNNLTSRNPGPPPFNPPPYDYGLGDPWNSRWPNSNSAWSVFPANLNQADPAKNPPANHCAPKDPISGAALTSCTIVLAGFDLAPDDPSDPNKLGFPVLNSRWLNYDQHASPQSWFNNALAAFATNVSLLDLERHFPWDQVPQLTWADLSHDAVSNPFLGSFTEGPPDTTGCVITTVRPPCAVNNVKPSIRKADHFLYPRQCTLDDLFPTNDPNVTRLRQCGLNFELHPNGWMDQWPTNYWTMYLPPTIKDSNQYGRTVFLFAGVPGMQLPVSYYKDSKIANGLSVYERVHNSSVFSLYLPIANEADDQMAMMGRNYTNQFYHDLLMSNHMELEPGDFAEGIRGKVLWHNEYRSKLMYDAFRTDNPSGAQANFPNVTFPAAFDPATAKAPFHNWTCDGCHLRNGSGIPINPNKTLPVNGDGSPFFPYMTPNAYDPYGGTKVKDYTFTGEIQPMKLVFFDLARRNISPSTYSNPDAFKGLYYANKIMNFYGDSFRVTQSGVPWSGTYTWSYGLIDKTKPHIEVVDTTERANSETGQIYSPHQVNLGAFTTLASASCQLNLPTPAGLPATAWPQNCGDITGDKITAAIAAGAVNAPGVPGGVGYMLLNGKRLGNLGAMEAIPNAAIAGVFNGVKFVGGFRNNQIDVLVALGVDSGVAAMMAGAIAWENGTRAGIASPRDPGTKLGCTPGSPGPNPLTNCWIGRFGWIGDRVSLEDQVANAAFIEMGMTSSTAYATLYPGGPKPGTFPIRYKFPNCGLANKTCIDTTTDPNNPSSKSNADLFDTDINRMADYARWLGSPTRSEFTVSLPLVITGEQVFKKLKCNTCHVIDKIPIDPNDTMLPGFYVDRLAVAPPAKPFLSYLGTDLLMHDMGYLSQVGLSGGTGSLSIRDPKTGLVSDGTCAWISPPMKCLDYRDWVQKIRTPALKGLRFNRFVTDSIRNTKGSAAPACDFLLHDGRACDAIQAAFLHDGPEIKALGMIGKLNELDPSDLQALRAFLYSL
jgi:hypothetical protein